MADSQLVEKLAEASITGDVTAAHFVIKAMIAEAESKNHHVVAKRLSNVLKYNRTAMLIADKDNHEGGRFLSLVTPKLLLKNLVLSNGCRAAVEQLITEQTNSKLLRENNLEPKHRVLLVGPPGNGKTSLANAIAYKLNKPFFVVRYESLVSSYLGETAGRLKEVFTYIETIAKKDGCVLFFDEFDVVSKERGDIHEVGEIKRLVSTLIMLIDDLPSNVVTLTATNHSELLDRAIWRRFQLRLELPAPTKKQLTQYYEKHLDFVPQKLLDSTVQSVVERLGMISYAEAEEYVIDMKRSILLSKNKNALQEIIEQQIALWEQRVKPDVAKIAI